MGRVAHYLRLGGAAVATALLLLVSAADALDPERQIGQYKHTRWTATEGAPPSIYALAQDRNGYLWMGSATGLYRFDGVTFEAIAAQGPDGRTRRPMSLLAARDGTLWIGFRDGGIAVYRDGVLRADPSVPRTNDYVSGLAQTRDGTIWATFFGYDQPLMRRAGGRWEHIGSDWGLPAAVAGNMVAAQDGSLWLLANNEIFRLRPGQRRFERVGSHGHGTAISEDPAGRIWISDARGSRILSGPPGSTSANFPTPTLTGWPSTARFDRDGNLWALKGVGLFRLRAPGNAMALPDRARAARVEPQYGAQEGLTSDSTGSILEDREGNIWIGTTLGLDRFRAANVVAEPLLATRMPLYGYGLLSASDGSVYVGTSDALYRIRPGGAPVIVAGGLSDVFQICEAADGGIFVFAIDQFLHLRNGRATRVSDPDQLPTQSHLRRGCVLDARSVLWMNATTGGLFSTRSLTWTRHPPIGPEDWAVTLIQDRQNRLLAWLNSGALVRLDANGRPERTLLRRGAGEVTTLYQGPTDLLMSGPSGLSRLRPEGLQTMSAARFRWLTDISEIVQTPEGQTWLHGLNGIVGLTTADLDRAFADGRAQLAPMILDFEDGLPNARAIGTQPGLVRGGDGRIWLTTASGVAWIDPARLHRNALPPPVHIRALIANGVRHRDPAGLTLTKGTSSLAIQYAGLSLAVPQRMRFRYRLDGIDEGWIDAGNRREAFYTNLGAGTYRFQVIAANNDGVWNEEGATLEFTIPPTFLQSIWFKLLVALSVGLLLWGLYLVRVRQLAGRIRLALEQRLAERERIARELHDTLLQSVQGLILRFQGAADRLAAGDPARRSIEGALDRANEVLIEGRERVLELRSDAAANDLPQALRDIAADAISGDMPHFALTVEGARRPLHALAGEEVQRIAEEVIRNALKHAGATRIEAILSYGGQEMRLTISDDGVGIPAEILARGEREGHYGLTGMRERAARIGARLTMTSVAGGGTETILSVPARAAYRARHGGLLDRLRGGRAGADRRPENAPAG